MIVCGHEAIAQHKSHGDTKTLHQTVILEHVEKDPNLLRVVGLANNGNVTFPFILPFEFYDEVTVGPLDSRSHDGNQPGPRSSKAAKLKSLSRLRYMLPLLNRDSFVDEVRYQYLKRLGFGSDPFVTIGWFDRRVVKFLNTIALPEVGNIKLDFVCGLSHVNLLLLNDQNHLEVFTVNEDAGLCDAVDSVETFLRSSKSIDIKPGWTHLVGMNLFNKNPWAFLNDLDELISVDIHRQSCVIGSTPGATTSMGLFEKICEKISSKQAGMLVKDESLYFKITDFSASSKTSFKIQLMKNLDR